ncbi:hypothetical protein FJ657_03260 [Schumannella soli]|uniref:DUF3558 domain-containing protein n=2 Tax=Schumannella soli TaxID=2590779 RepID=A0A506Y814_9MICO|nr:hypothetical protein FJ657_03260 [Schumannella soli]
MFGALALAAASLAGCAVGAPARDATPASGAKSGTAAGAGTGDATPADAVRDLPKIASCDEVGAVVASYIDGIPLSQEESYIQSDEISCVWSPPQGSITDLSQIQTFGVTISEGEDEIPDPAALGDYGSKLYFTDPRLDAVGGIALWLTTDTSVVGGGTGTVLVPGVEVTLVDARWDQNAYLDKDALVTLGLQLLAL